MVLLRRAERGWFHTLTICFYVLLNIVILVRSSFLCTLAYSMKSGRQRSSLFSSIAGGWDFDDEHDSRASEASKRARAILFLGLETIFTGLAGILDQRRRTVCIIYEVLCSVSAFGSAVLSLFIFSQSSKMVKQFESFQFDSMKLNKLFWNAGLALLFLFAIEATAMFLAFLLHCYSPLDNYETLDQTRQRRAFGFFGLRNDIGIANERANAKQAKSLASKMNQKYGKWSHEAFG